MRKIIQIAGTDKHIFALCEDGTFWRFRDRVLSCDKPYWIREVDISEDKKTETPKEDKTNE